MNSMKRSLLIIIPAAIVIVIMISSCAENRSTNPVNPVPGKTTVTTLAGPYFQVTYGSGSPATFSAPTGVAVDAAGNVYVADQGNNLIRKISPPYGIVTTLAGSGQAGSANGTGANASFNKPWGVAADAAGNVYVADYGNNLIRMISPAGVVSTLAGSGQAGSANGTGTAAYFNLPSGVAVDALGNVYVADHGNNMIRKISSSGVVSTLAGSFNRPTGVAVDTAGNVYVVDQGSESIRLISPAGVVSTLAGSGQAGSANGTGIAASFTTPYGLAVDAEGNVYVADEGNQLIRKISPAGVVSTLAGGGTGDSANGAGTAAAFHNPFGVAVDAAGNVYVADFSSNMIRKIDTYGVVSTLAGTGTPGAANSHFPSNDLYIGAGGLALDNVGNVYVADYGNNSIDIVSATGTVNLLAGYLIPGSANGTGEAASFDRPYGVALDTLGNILVADSGNNMIREISPLGAVTTFAGSGQIGNQNNTSTNATFHGPSGVAVGARGFVYVADAGNNMIRQITSFGFVTTLAGYGLPGSVDGTGTSAYFNNPTGVAVDTAGNVYVADAGNNLIRKISPMGVVTTFAGSGGKGSNNGTGTIASFNNPHGVALDAAGNVYVADAGNNQIRKISPAGVVTTLAGSAIGAAGAANGAGYAATFNEPIGLAVDAEGTVYVADYANNLIRKITQ